MECSHSIATGAVVVPKNNIQSAKLPTQLLSLLVCEDQLQNELNHQKFPSAIWNDFSRVKISPFFLLKMQKLALTITLLVD